ncbi:MAG: metallophosphoesterase [Candidatus Eremiobacteraeota bacterium]|nr:metallophosphoesterase [Candidatus Eremiobacteraeota bacterium]
MPFLRRLSASLALAAALCAPAHAASRTWLVVGDIHLDPSARYDTLAPVGHDTDGALFASAIAAMARVEPDPPVLVITGDLLAHSFRGDGLATMRRIADAFDRAFPRAQFVLAVGNNDDPCGDYRVGSDTTYLERLAAIWTPLVNRGGVAPGFAQQFARGGYYTVALPGHTRAIVLNSVLWSWRAEECSPFPPGSGADEMQWLAKTLAEREPGERLFIAMHIPPGVDAYSTSLIQGIAVVPFLAHDSNQAFISTVARYRERISAIVAGHEHSDDKRIVGGVPLLVVSSISPIYGNAPSFDALDVNVRGIAHLRTYALKNGAWAPTLATIAHMNAGNGLFFTCARTELGDGYAACAGIPRRRDIAVLVFALVAAAFTSLPLLGLIRGGMKSQADRAVPRG